MRRNRRTTLAIKRPYRQRLKRRSLTNQIASNRSKPRTDPKKRSYQRRQSPCQKISASSIDNHASNNDFPKRRKNQSEIGTQATAQRKSRRQRSNQTGKGPGEKPSSSPEK
ncbi:hypothetical protein HID58_039309 [Brassica napus]|uniref:(rape) hypothetical protein n=1 Tax=Brassica napus TaxID=3708 RepID=A0A817BJ66_BRANA|nr:hypothetical protein HID58_039309 [Brassica napus]CAF2350147.1 unnamed protein product [Brassica napus]